MSDHLLPAPDTPDESASPDTDPDLDAFCTWLVGVLVEALWEKLELARRAHAAPDADDAPSAGND